MCDIKRLVIGKLTKPQGLRGEIRVHYYGSDPYELHRVKKATLYKSDGGRIELELEKVRMAGKAVILKFKTIDSIDDTKDLIGSLVHVDRAELNNLKDDEYYFDDLIGMLVYDETGELIGKLESIFETGSNDVYVVKRGKKEILIPAISDVIRKVDVNEKKMYVHLMDYS